MAKLTKTQTGELAYLAHAYKYEEASASNMRNPGFAVRGGTKASTYVVLEREGLIEWTTKGHPFGRAYPVPTGAGVQVGLAVVDINSAPCGCWRCRVFAGR